MHRKLTMMLLICAAGCISLVSSATAAAATPTGEYKVFAQCPYEGESTHGCIYATTESGEFIVGKKTVPITKTITLQGGTEEENAEGKATLIAASNGETLSKTPQNVPGGLSGLVNCTEISNFIVKLACEAFFEKGAMGVTATTELAGSASSVYTNTGNLINGKGTALELPVKVHLENAFLGSECYVGSNSDPIDLELTTGTTSPPAPNKAIKGNVGTEEFNEEGTIITFSKNSLVNNSFAAPGANGCGGVLSFIIDPIIEDEMGIPSAAGHNTAILDGTLKQTSAKAVRKHLEE